jgi:hypothetical protein
VCAGSPTLNSTFEQIQDRPAMNYLLIYHFFGLLWTTQFIQVRPPRGDVRPPRGAVR